MTALRFNPLTRELEGSGTVVEAFAAGRASVGAGVTAGEPALLLAESLAAWPELVARLGAVSAGTAHYANDSQLRELVHRHLLAILAARGDLDPTVQATAVALAAGLEQQPLHRAFLDSAIRTRLGAGTAHDAHRAAAFLAGPGAALIDAAVEVLTPELAVGAPPVWLADLGPLITSTDTAVALVAAFTRLPKETS